jgi:uncharacterized protein YndB with AHSA1/START domain
VTDGITLLVRRTIRAPADRIFDAWTRPEHLRAWWGPRPVTCSGAEVDLRVGGHYRIDNALPDGTTLAIRGSFRTVDRPHKLVYTWRMGAEPLESLVTVRFEPSGDDATDVIIVHEQLPNQATHDSHDEGWNGCLEGLVAFLAPVAR